MTLEFRVQHDVDTDAAPTPPSTATRRSGFSGWVDRFHDHRAEVRRRRLRAALTEIAELQALLEEARDVIDRGWVQHAWFAYVDDRGRTRTASSAAAADVAGRPLVGACLVGAVVYAAGGPHAVHSPRVQCALDLVWHALEGQEGAPVQWCPPPDVRMSRVRDLTRWNDVPARTAIDVTSLLLTAERVAVHESERIVARAAAREAAPA
jgi:hypothetical protein